MINANWAAELQRHEGFGSNPLLPHETRPITLVSQKTRSGLKREVTERCPPVPGVYGILDRSGALIYVGKSKSLRHRLLSYFQSSSRPEKSGRIIESARGVQWETQPSEFAALLREQHLIRKFRPRWNVQGIPERQRPIYLCLGRQPAVYFFTSSKPPKDLIACEGPFYGAARMNRAVDALNQFFKLRDCSQRTPFYFTDQLSLFDVERRPGCLRYETGTCMGPCAAACSRTAYDIQVNAAQSFLDGFNDEPLIALRDSMEIASSNRQYELAAKRLVDYKSLEYLYKKLTYLAEVRRGYSFIYPVRGYDHCHLWYLIRAGEVADVIPAPACEETFGAVRERIEDWSAQTGNPFDRGHGRHGHTLNLVASWFRNNRQELDTTFPPHKAAERLGLEPQCSSHEPVKRKRTKRAG
jgi:excinuclease ABC subunit C